MAEQQRSCSRSRSPGSKRNGLLKDAIDSLVEAAKRREVAIEHLAEARSLLREAEQAANDAASDARKAANEFQGACNQLAHAKALKSSTEIATLYRHDLKREAEEKMLEARAAVTTAENCLTQAREGLIHAREVAHRFVDKQQGP